MRIIKLILVWSVLITTMTAVGFFLTRETLLFLGTASIKESLLVLKQAHAQGRYGVECIERNSEVISGESPVKLQLRFLSSKEYVLEAVCSQFSLSPIVIERKQLLNFVTKKPGTSGIIWDELTYGGIELVVFEELAAAITEKTQLSVDFLTKQRAVVVDNREIFTASTFADGDQGPVTSCEGYGYQCCEEVSQAGVGGQILGLPECQANCFSRCATRPLVLSFTSSPFFDPKTREVEVNTGTVVEFTYVADAGEASDLTATIEYGDGIQGKLSGETARSSHMYECAQGSCRYGAILSLTDTWGVSSHQTPISTIDVIVKAQ